MNYTDHTTAVTARLVDMIRTGSHGEWVMPWHTHGTAALFNTRNAITGTPYTGANTVALFLDALERGFPTADYATFNQYRKAGAQVRRGERAAYVIKWVTPKNRTGTEHSAADRTDGEHVERRLVPKVYAVFNAHQVDGHDPCRMRPSSRFFNLDARCPRAFLPEIRRTDRRLPANQIGRI